MLSLMGKRRKIERHIERRGRVGSNQNGIAFKALGNARGFRVFLGNYRNIATAVNVFARNVFAAIQETVSENRSVCERFYSVAVKIHIAVSEKHIAFRDFCKIDSDDFPFFSVRIGHFETNVLIVLFGEDEFDFVIIDEQIARNGNDIVFSCPIIYIATHYHDGVIGVIIQIKPVRTYAESHSELL